MNAMYIMLCFLVGCGIAIQASVNAALGKATTLPSFATLMSFTIGLVPIFIYYAIESHGFKQGVYQDLKWWMFLGGFLGAAYVLVIILTVPHLGAAVVLSATIVGQVVLGLFLDHFALLDIEQRTASFGRILGTFLIILGAIFLSIF